MIVIQEVIVEDDHYIITFSDGLEIYGMLLMLVDGVPDYIEFMEYDNDSDELILITEDDNPEEYERLVNTYYEKVLELI